MEGMPDLSTSRGDLNPEKAHKSWKYAGAANFL
jgi:hypothetical protein